MVYPVGSVPVYTPKDCTRVQDESSSTPGRYKLVCELRTINSEFDKTNFSVIPSLGTVSLTILCAESIPSESRLNNNYNNNNNNNDDNNDNNDNLKIDTDTQ